MTIIMTAKNQITIPKRITDVLRLSRGSMFNVEVCKNRIELIPLEATERKYSEDVYEKMELLTLRESGKEKKITKKFIDKLKKGKD